MNKNSSLDKKNTENNYQKVKKDNKSKYYKNNTNQYKRKGNNKTNYSKSKKDDVNIINKKKKKKVLNNDKNITENININSNDKKQLKKYYDYDFEPKIILKKSNKRKNRPNKYLIIMFTTLILLIIVLIFILCSELTKNQVKNSSGRNITYETKVDYNNYYKDIVKTLKDKNLYKLENGNFVLIGSVKANNVLKLEKDEYVDKGYFKILNLDFYIDYKDIEETSIDSTDSNWKNYIPYNESIKISNGTIFYQNDEVIFEINEEMMLPILIKEKAYYGVLYKENLFYVKKDAGVVIENKNTSLEYTSGISALVYHATYDSNNSAEKKKCIKNNSTICLSDIQFGEQMKYLKDNNFYTATMKDIEMFIDGKIRLPKKTVLITIDDGYFIDAAVKVLENYDLHATLFLIGALADLDEWKTDAFYSNSLELHSHTYMMHTPNVCKGGQGSPLKCLDKETLLADLKKSREQLHGSTVFCYPFFEYNDYAIDVLKEAGFTMAFAGGRQKIKVGSNKMKLPRYGVINTSTLSDFKKIVN